MEKQTIQIEVSIHNLTDTILDLLVSKPKLSIEIVKALDTEMQDWAFTMALYDYFATQKALFDVEAM
jgi:hypothetical protein